MRRGIEERFGADVLAKVEKLGQVPQTTLTDSGLPIEFMLTKQASRQHAGNFSLSLP